MCKRAEVGGHPHLRMGECVQDTEQPQDTCVNPIQMELEEDMGMKPF